MRANGNFSDASLERLHSLSVGCVMNPSDAVDLVDLESPLGGHEFLLNKTISGETKYP